MFPAAIAALLQRGGLVPDAVFDAHLPAAVRAASDEPWTPREVMATVAFVAQNGLSPVARGR